MSIDIIQKARNDLAVYCLLMGSPSYTLPTHLEVLADALMEFEANLLAGKNPRMCVLMPPRHGKSMMCSQFFPTWYWGRNPSDQVAWLTYNQPFANKWGRFAKHTLKTQLYDVIFGTPNLINDSNSELLREDGGVLQYFGRESGVTGKGAHLFIIDDIIKNYKEAISPTILESIQDMVLTVADTRLMPERNGVLLIMTRWTSDDLGGWMPKNIDVEDWSIMRLPAICDSYDDPIGRKIGEPLWPEKGGKFSIDGLLKVKANYERSGKHKHWMSLYQQNPTIEGGNLVSVGSITELDELPKLSKVVLSVDPSLTDKEASDPWGFTMFGQFGTKHVIIESFSKRVGLNPGISLIMDKVDEYGVSAVLVEEKALGYELIKGLKAAAKDWTKEINRVNIISINEKNTPLTKSKTLRMVDANETVDGNNVCVYRFGPGCMELIQKLSVFPESDDDHEADAFSQYLNYYKRKSTFTPRESKRG